MGHFGSKIIVSINDVNDFSLKSFIWGKWAILGNYWHILVILDACEGFFLNFAQGKRLRGI